MRALPCLVLLILLTSAEVFAARPFVIHTQVPATEGRSCKAYLAAPTKGGRGRAVVLAMQGTGEYTSSGNWEKYPMARAAFDAGAAWLVFDKPGITADASDPRGFRIDDAVYTRYTPADLEACAIGALLWASSLPQVGARSPIVLQGHSEGALIGSRLLLTLHARHPELSGRVSAALLSGLPGAGMKEILALQARADGVEAQYEKALATGDDAFVRQRAGLGAATLRSLIALPPPGDTFAELVKHRPQTRIVLFHGLEDVKTPVEWIRALEKENEARLDHGEPALELYVRYYQGGHRLNLAAVHDMNLWIAEATKSNGYLATADRDANHVGPAVTEEAIASVVGRYRLDDETVLEIEREGQRLFARLTGMERIPVYFSDADTLDSRAAPVSFEVERKDGEISALFLVQGGRFRCPRIPVEASR